MQVLERLRNAVLAATRNRAALLTVWLRQGRNEDGIPAVTVAGIDFSTHAVDVVLLDEDSDRAVWHRFELTGQDAFERARFVRAALWPSSLFDDVLACGIEDPRGYGAGSLYRIQGAILGRLPGSLLVQPWVPSAWRKAVGLPGNCTKERVQLHVAQQRPTGWLHTPWPFDACDAYCIALATRSLLETSEAA